MARNIDDVVEEVLPLSTGRFRFRLVVAGMVFHSEPVTKDRFLMEFENMLADHPDLSAVQYEVKSSNGERWQTF